MAFDKHLFVKRLKKIGLITLWTSLVVGLLASLAFINKQEQQTVCTAIQVHIEPDNEAANFVDREMILKQIRKDGDEKKILGLNLNSINIPWLEKKLRNNSMIKTAEVYTDMNGSLNIHIVQRRPILRVMNAFNESYYLDEDGLKMPLSPDYTAHVPVATGYIFEHGTGRDSAQSSTGKDLFKIATYVDKDTFWNAQIEQIFVTAEGELELIPTIGSQTIFFGDANDIEDKFKRLLLFYKEAMNRVGWETYSNINVKYKNQIVCKKNNNQ